jgi:hypothetical protein
VCRNIRPLYNFDPPASEEEIRAAALQYVRKISGFNKPSKVNEAVFHDAVDEITRISSQLLAALETSCTTKRSGTRSRARPSSICTALQQVKGHL